MLALAFAVLCTTAVVVFLQVFCALAFPFSLFGRKLRVGCKLCRMECCGDQGTVPWLYGTAEC